MAISIHAPRTGSDVRRDVPPPCVAISIHAPRTGSDLKETPWEGEKNAYFNPRSPHGERRSSSWGSTSRMRFQSTLPARGATLQADFFYWLEKFQSTLPARGATFRVEFTHAEQLISIHAPRTGSDEVRAPRPCRPRNFNPRSPHGERRVFPSRSPLLHRISIHAPRTGSDSQETSSHAPPLFQSTLPARGATGKELQRFVEPLLFQSTLPARGATCAVDQPHAGDGISIHAPRTGSDRRADVPANSQPISIHAPRTGSDSPSAA